MNTILLQDHLNDILQKNVCFDMNNKTLREGKLVIYNIKDFYISFTLITKKDQQKVYELPVPFESYRTGTDLIFDYSLPHITKNSTRVEYLLTSLKNKIGKKCKFYNNKLIIRSNLIN